MRKKLKTVSEPQDEEHYDMHEEAENNADASTGKDVTTEEKRRKQRCS